MKCVQRGQGLGHLCTPLLPPFPSATVVPPPMQKGCPRDAVCMPGVLTCSQAMCGSMAPLCQALCEVPVPNMMYFSTGNSAYSVSNV